MHGCFEGIKAEDETRPGPEPFRFRRLSRCLARSCTERKMEAKGVTLHPQVISSSEPGQVGDCSNFSGDHFGELPWNIHGFFNSVEVFGCQVRCSHCWLIISCRLAAHRRVAPIPAPTTMSVSKPQTFCAGAPKGPVTCKTTAWPAISSRGYALVCACMLWNNQQNNLKWVVMLVATHAAYSHGSAQLSCKPRMLNGMPQVAAWSLPRHLSRNPERVPHLTFQWNSKQRSRESLIKIPEVERIQKAIL